MGRSGLPDGAGDECLREGGGGGAAALRAVPEEVARGHGGRVVGRQGGEQRHPGLDRRAGVVQDDMV